MPLKPANNSGRDNGYVEMAPDASTDINPLACCAFAGWLYCAPYPANDDY
jgi:hypothetical protein